MGECPSPGFGNGKGTPYRSWPLMWVSLDTHQSMASQVLHRSFESHRMQMSCDGQLWPARVPAPFSRSSTAAERTSFLPTFF